ncbi:MAG: PEP-CTERM sorting domain-containing protein [Bythopirellula sp.]|nr:PEP-CTERM sorting domain-containing protein [Bythopirellula sp.]
MSCFDLSAWAVQLPAQLRRSVLCNGLVTCVETGFTSFVALCFVFGLPTTSYSDPGGFRSNTVSYSVAGTLDFGNRFSGSDFVQTLSDSTDPNSIAAPAKLKATVADSIETGGAISEASITVEARADFGSLSIDFNGFLNRNSTDASQIGDAWLTNARVQARWQDTVKMDSTVDPQPGRIFHMEAHLVLDGGMGIELKESFPLNFNRFAASEVNLRLSGGGVYGREILEPATYDGIYFAQVKKSSLLTVDVVRPAKSKIDVDIFYQEGALFTMDFLMEVRAVGRVNVGSYYRTVFDNSFSSTFYANYGHTLRWGGITSVTDAATGEPIEGWTMTSASGFDYAHPAPVPEPATVGLALLGLLGLMCRRTCA